MKLRGIDTLDRADALAGTEVFVPEERLDSLEEGAFYHFQIIGSRVLTKEGKKIGEVKGLLPVKDESLLIVENEGKELLIPFTKALCPEVDPLKKEIRVSLPDGLLDLNEI